MSGGSLTTKGLVSGGGAVAPPAALPPPPPGPLPIQATTPTGSVMIVVPTATNVALMAAENITANLRVQQESNLSLPSLYKRAYLIAYQSDEIAVVKP